MEYSLQVFINIGGFMSRSFKIIIFLSRGNKSVFVRTRRFIEHIGQLILKQAVEQERRDSMHSARFSNITAFFLHRISSLEAYTSTPWDIFDVTEIKWKLDRREICFTKLHFTIVNMIIIVYKNIHFFDVLEHFPCLTLTLFYYVGFEVSTAMTMQETVFWDLALCIFG
jgi:hypothetical protein